MIPHLLVAALVLSQAPVVAGSTDPRIQVVTYDPGQIVPLPVETGYAVVVELAPDERIENVIVGNSAVWQVDANNRRDHLVVKQLAGATTTNMVVITDARRYVFLLIPSGGHGSAPFLLRFAYPDSRLREVRAINIAATFRFSGAKELFPVFMQDDGYRTTITWGRNTILPAIFAVDARGSEGIVNGRMEGADYVIEGTAGRYTFRLGKARVIATRRALKVTR